MTKMAMLSIAEASLRARTHSATTNSEMMKAQNINEPARPAHRPDNL